MSWFKRKPKPPTSEIWYLVPKEDMTAHELAWLLIAQRTKPSGYDFSTLDTVWPFPIDEPPAVYFEHCGLPALARHFFRGDERA